MYRTYWPVIHYTTHLLALRARQVASLTKVRKAKKITAEGGASCTVKYSFVCNFFGKDD